MSEVIHKPHPGAQEAFLSSPVDDLFIGGEKGNGKSWLLLAEDLYDIDQPDGHSILFRRTFTDLEDLWHKAHEFYAGYNPRFNDQKHLITFPSGYRARMAHLQHPKDVYNHTGQEYHLIKFDERPNFPKFVVDFMRSCLRTTNPKLKTRERSTGNPVGEGIFHVKARYIDVLKPYEIGYFKTVNDRDVRTTKDDPEAMSRMWIPGIRAENKTLMEADPNYERKLDNLPENLKRAFKYGIWDANDKPYQLIKTIDWQKALLGPDVAKSVWAYIGADYALSGDRCVICSGRGNRVERFIEFEGMTQNQFADKIEEEIARYGKYQVMTAIDATGVGSGVYNELVDRGHVNLLPCTYKDPSFAPKINKETMVKLKFDTFRSMSMWKLRESFEAGEIDLSALQTGNGYYDNIHLLEEEVLFFTYTLLGDKVHILKKLDAAKVQMGNGEPGLGRSPDRLDALHYWNWVRGQKPTQPRKEEYRGQDYNIRGRTIKKKRSAYV